ncbi:MmcQ/YjbR family DNA-binding protein [Pseudarthrobacter sp. RMG13]|uniref:MmcQ/YjbR family DNA-binding protein n=1 Tax=Pseudarthrobacter humi TaxID=2952523 RepID=A0ABT1LVU2_9MICC|nr:MmcQ/YjbR family DNA-binding protein [Pseudarthrobacter humi]MCP9001753.1 MmcQ/YjbR family DNA-binding protein [Pseudarthrobacter humi]
MATESEVRSMCLALPGVTERSSWDQPAWFAKTLMARIWEDGVLTVKSAEREALAGTEPDTYFWTPHHERSPQLVLVRLARVGTEELGELLEESYRLAGGHGSARAAGH